MTDITLRRIQKSALAGTGCPDVDEADNTMNDIPIIMVTPEPEKPGILEAVNLGASNSLVKPFQIAAPKEKLLHVLKPE